MRECLCLLVHLPADGCGRRNLYQNVTYVGVWWALAGHLTAKGIERHWHAFLKLPADSHSPEHGNNSGSRPAACVAEQSNLSKVQPVNDWRTGRACICVWKVKLREAEQTLYTAACLLLHNLSTLVFCCRLGIVFSFKAVHDPLAQISAPISDTLLPKTTVAYQHMLFQDQEAHTI